MHVARIRKLSRLKSHRNGLLAATRVASTYSGTPKMTDAINHARKENDMPRKAQHSSSGTITEYKSKTGTTYRPRYYSTENGKRVDKYGNSHATKKAARAELTSILNAINIGVHVDKTELTVEQWLMDWLDKWAVEVGPKAKERYSTSLAWYVVPTLGKMKLQDVTLDDVQGLYAHLRNNGRRIRRSTQGPGLARVTILSIHDVFKRAMQQAVVSGMIVRNPCSNVKIKKADDDAPGNKRADEKPGVVSVRDCLSQSQLTALLEKFKDHDFYPLVNLAAATGARRGELLALKWSDLDFVRNKIAINKTLEEIGRGNERTIRAKAPKTKSGTRTLDLPPDSIAVLREHRAKQMQAALAVGVNERNGLMFPKHPWEPHEYESPGSLTRRFTRLARWRGFNVHLHQLRHSLASLMLRNHVPVTDVARRLGHANAAITLQIYSHSIESDQQHTVDAVAQIMRGGK